MVNPKYDPEIFLSPSDDVYLYSNLTSRCGIKHLCAVHVLRLLPNIVSEKIRSLPEAIYYSVGRGRLKVTGIRSFVFRTINIWRGRHRCDGMQLFGTPDFSGGTGEYDPAQVFEMAYQLASMVAKRRATEVEHRLVHRTLTQSGHATRTRTMFLV